MALRITSRNERGVADYCGKNEDENKLPLKGIAQGSTFFNLETSSVKIFYENPDNPNLDGEWIEI